MYVMMYEFPYSPPMLSFTDITVKPVLNMLKGQSDDMPSSKQGSVYQKN